MTRIIAACIWVAICNTGCVATKLRHAYDHIQIGAPISEKFSLPADAKWVSEGELRRVSVDRSKKDAPAHECITVLLDADEHVVAKHYECSITQLNWLFLWVSCRSDALWEIDRRSIGSVTQAADQDRLSSLESACRRLFGDKEREYYTNFLSRFFLRAHANRTNTSDVPDVLIKSENYTTLRGGMIFKITNTPKTVRVEINDDKEISIVAWTIAGYAYAATHGGRID